jgi:hypothetical protein
VRLLIELRKRPFKLPADMLEEMTLCEEVFHTPSGIAFADVITDGHRETWPIRSKRFRTGVRRCYYQATGAAPGGAVIVSALDLLEARAQFDAPERAVSMRVAEHAGRIYLDLADEHWRAVAIGADGWRVIGCPPVRFRRSPGMLPLPVPERGGSVEILKPFLNLSNENDFVLIVAWLLAALRPGGPYPLLAISGEQGSAKTVLSKVLRALVDPNVAPVRALPREERELMIAANNGHLLALENHDEPRAAVTFSGPKEHAAAVAVATAPGAKLIYDGQIEGRKVKLPVFLDRRPAEPRDDVLVAFYRCLLNTIDADLFHVGEWHLCEVHGWADNASFHDIVAWSLRLGVERTLVVLNLADHGSQAIVQLPWEDLRGRTWRLVETLDRECYVRDGDELATVGLFVDLDAWRYHFLRFE